MIQLPWDTAHIDSLPDSVVIYFTYGRHIPFLCALFESSKTFPCISGSKWGEIYSGSIVV